MTMAKDEREFQGIGKPAERALANAGHQRLEDLAKVSEKELARLHGMGPKALGILRQRLADRGLQFRS
jgi:predicted flap endonuclease-1-like 5' DNA nuclease